MFTDAAETLPKEPMSVPKSVYHERQQRFLSS